MFGPCTIFCLFILDYYETRGIRELRISYVKRVRRVFALGWSCSHKWWGTIKEVVKRFTLLNLSSRKEIFKHTQPENTCLKLTIETLEQDVKCSKLTIKTTERRHWDRSVVFIVNFEHISHRGLAFLLLTLNM